MGISSNPKERLRKHLLYEDGNSQKFFWIKELRKKDGLPEMKILEVSDEANWVKREQWWIRYFRRKNQNLTNLTSGGQGTYGIPCSVEKRQKISKSLMGHEVSEEARKKMSTAVKQHLKKNKHPMLGRKHSEETRRKLSDSHTGYIMPESQKRNIAKANSGSKNYLWKDISLSQILELAIQNGFKRNVTARELGVSNKTVTNKIRLFGYKDWNDFFVRENKIVDVGR